MERFESLLEHVGLRELSQVQAAELLGMSERTFRRWRDRYEEEGLAGLFDRRLGKASARVAPADRIVWLLDQYETVYRGWTVKHFHDHVRAHHGFGMSYSWTKNRLQATGLVKRAPRRGAHRLFAACDGRTRVLFVNSPNNPTGWMMAADEQAAVLAFCRQRGIWLIADEVYDRIVYEGGRAPSLVELAQPEDLVVAVNSFSKSWCMTGWRMGWVTAPESLGRVLEMMNEYNVAGANTIAQHAGITALAEGEPFIAETVAHYRRGRDLVYQRFAAMERVTMALPPAAFYAFFAVDGLDDGLAFAKRLVLEHGVGLAPGSAFGESGEGYSRLCLASTPETLGRALDRLERALG